MDIKKIFEYVKSLPVWARIVVVVAASVVAVSLVLTSCGTPRTMVTVSENGSSTIEQNTTSSTTTTITVRNVRDK